MTPKKAQYIERAAALLDKASEYERQGNTYAAAVFEAKAVEYLVKANKMIG
jgi:HEPN domain-containing protein